MTDDLSIEKFPIEFEYQGVKYKGEGTSIPQTGNKPLHYKIVLDDVEQGNIWHVWCDNKKQWESDILKDQGLVNAIGAYIEDFRE